MNIDTETVRRMRDALVEGGRLAVNPSLGYLSPIAYRESLGLTT